MILIFTAKTDSHVGFVSRHLDAAGVAWVRVNTEEFATNVELTINPTACNGILFVRDSGKRIDLSRVTAVWYRKPEPVAVGHLAVEAGALEYVEAEFTEILMGIYALLKDAIWINNPFTTRHAHRKLLQLRVATEVGFKTPRTILTNDVEIALGFAAQIGADLAIKSIGSLCVSQELEKQTVHYGLFTRRISREELETAKDKVRYMPTLFQEFVEKRCELRITCVGEQVFACCIEARSGDITSDDHRFDTKKLNHSAYECPELHGKLHAYMRASGLNFACFDVIITKSGDAVFLEANPNGQWLWCEEMATLPIGEAIAGELMGRKLEMKGR